MKKNNYFICIYCSKKIKIKKNTNQNETICSDCKRSILVEFTCNNCSAKESKSLKALSRSGNLCKKCTREKTNLERFGVTHALKSPFLKKKQEETCIRKFGTSNCFGNKEIQKKSRESLVKKYGVDNAAKATEVMEKIKKTNLERYGVECVFRSTEVQKKIEETNITKYGSKCSLQNESVKRKSINTLVSKYGVDNAAKNKDIIKKIQKTNIQKYGYTSFAKSELFHQKRSSKYLYKGLWFDSSWELAFWIYHQENNIPIERNTLSFIYTQNEKTRSFTPDFLVEGNLVEIKGDHLSKVYPEQSAASEKIQVCKENNIQVLFQKDVQFYLDYIKSKYGKTYLKSFKDPFKKLLSQAKDKRGEGFSTNFSNIILKYHPSVWKCHAQGYKSPYEALHDDVLLDKAIKNQLQYRPDDLSFEMTLKRFSVARIAKRVSLFSQHLAFRLVNTYLSDANEVFDPFSGFSGRLLGVNKAGKKYIGQDLNMVTVTEANNLINQENLTNCSVVTKDLFESTGNYESLFTCSPYNLKETWTTDIKDLSCDEWIDECLRRFNCKKYLFVVDTTDKYKDNIVESIVKKSHFGNRTEYVILIKK